MDRAAERLAQAVRGRERVCIYGDYDADGVTATAILVRGLRRLGLQSEYYLPDRRTEGYGLHAQAVAHLASRGPGLLVAVDCGITAPAAADAARAQGLDLVILDHHEPAGPLPVAAAVVHPGRRTAGSEAAAGAELCAAGLAYQAWRALCARLGVRDEDGDLLELAALGTVADMAPLLGDNRILVARGLELMDPGGILGLRALARVASLGPPFSARDLSFALAPRVNAAGRLAHAATAVRLLLTEDPAEAEAIAVELDRLNRERRALCERVLAEAVREAEAGGALDQPALVLAGEGWHPGVVGIVASQMVERYYRPTVLIALQAGLGKGSARSIPPLHLVQALSAASGRLTAFGGHAMAAGLTIAADSVDEFRSAFVAAVAGRLRAGDLEPSLCVDAEIPLEAATVEQAAELGRLAPFGSGNDPPVLATRGLRVLGTRLVGEGAHLRLVVGDGVRTAEAIAFRQGELAELLAFTQTRVDLAYTLEEDRWRDAGTVRLVVQDIQTPDLNPAEVTSSAAQLLERLFDRADDYLDPARGEIEEADAFHTKVVGVTFEGRQAVVATVRAGEPLRLVRDPRNPRDPHAVQVCRGDGQQIGFLRAALAARIAPAMDAGALYSAVATAVTGGGERAWGLNIRVSREKPGGEATPEARPPDEAGAAGRGSPLGLVAALMRGRPLPEQQQEVQDAVLTGGPIAARFGPGRGLLSGVLAAAGALVSRGDGPVLVALPRSGVVEAWNCLGGACLRAVGLRAAGAHGLLRPQEAARVGAAWSRGDLDVLFASMLWLEERPPQAGAVIAVLDPQCPASDLALLRDKYAERLRLLSGTLRQGALAQAAAALRIERVAPAGRARANLRILDHRASHDAHISLGGESRARRGKTLVLAGGSAASVATARALRAGSPEMAGAIAYYHAGLPAALRRVLEDLLASGHLAVLVTGSYLVSPALPLDVARVVVCGLLPDPLLALDCMASAGLGGGAATVELRFGPDALSAAAAVVEARCPSRATLARCYRELRARARGDEIPEADVPRDVSSACLTILVEAGVLALEGGEGSGARYTLLAVGTRGDLERSLRYREGMRERAAWEHLRVWASGPPARLLEDLAGP